MTRQPRNPHAKLGLTSKASAEDAERAHKEVVDFLAGAPESVRRWARDEIAAADDAYAAISNPARATKARGGSPLKRLAVGIVTVAAAVAVVVGIYNMGGGKSGADSQNSGTAKAPSLSPGDQVRVSQLMRKLKSDPEDAATLAQLGNVFFNANDFNSAGAWMQRALAVEPGNVQARLALGASEFNLGDIADARSDWLRVIAADPENVEAYYDLGFLYVSSDPPDMANAKKMWGKVVELAPDSSVAKTVSTHLEGLEKAEATSAANGSAGGEG